MSTPINPLSRYRSYAYQQVLIACDTTETAEALAANNQFLDFTRSSDADRVSTPSQPYAKYAPYNIALENGRSGHYCIIINGTQDAEFVINSAKWYSTVAADAGGVGNDYFTYDIGGELEIQEPQGIRFMNVMAEVADQLQSNASGLVFLLKTIFVGHPNPNYENDAFPDPVTNIRPVLFWIADITGKFTVTGGEYKVEFAGVNHGVTKQKHILHGAKRITIDIAKGDSGCEANTLSGALCQLQSQIGTIYDKYYQQVKDEVENTVGPDGKKMVFDGRKVSYVIEAEQPLDGPDYLVTDFKDAATNTGETNKAGIIVLTDEPSVEAAILAIAKRCPKIQEDLVTGDGQDTKKVRYVPKVATTIESTDTEYRIVYKLRRVIESRDDILTILAQRQNDNLTDLDEKILQNTLELDYMYTGKNTDILDFDIKMELGLTLFQNMTTTENVPSSAETTDGGVIQSSTAKAQPIDVAATKSGRLRTKTPIFLSSRVEEESIRHVRNPKRAVDFQELMNRHAAIENIEAVCKIHGNPGLLNAVNRMPSDIVAIQKDTDTQANKDTNIQAEEGIPENQDVFPYWETIPAIVKINIKMPGAYFGGARNSTDYSEPFWYEGFYYCYAIEQIFDGGEFTQQLHMVSIPRNSPEENQQSEVSQTEQVEQTQTENQATKTSGAGTSAGTSSASNPLTITITKDASFYTSKEYQETHTD